jgi:hypothetical protein
MVLSQQGKSWASQHLQELVQEVENANSTSEICG